MQHVLAVLLLWPSVAMADVAKQCTQPDKYMQLDWRSRTDLPLWDDLKKSGHPICFVADIKNYDGTTYQYALPQPNDNRLIKIDGTLDLAPVPTVRRRSLYRQCRQSWCAVAVYGKVNAYGQIVVTDVR